MVQPAIGFVSKLHKDMGLEPFERLREPTYASLFLVPRRGNDAGSHNFSNGSYVLSHLFTPLFLQDDRSRSLVEL